MENEAIQAEQGSEEEVTKTYTQDEVNSMLQKEVDRRISSAQKKWEKNLENRMSEAEKLRSMTDEQKKAYDIEQREKEIQRKESEFSLMANKIECSKILNDKGLPQVFVEYVVAEDAETMSQRITDFEMAFKAAVQDAVSKKIQTKAPLGGTAATAQTGLTKEKFRKMGLSEKQNLKNTNPALYSQMISQ